MNLFTKRFLFIKIIILFTAFLIISRLFYLQIINHSFFINYAKKEYKRKKTEVMPRGNIRDLNGNILASSIVKWDVVLMKKEFDFNQQTLMDLSQTLDMKITDLKKKISKGKNYIKIKKGIEKDVYDKIINLNIKGIVLEPHQSRIYPSETARELIGLANENEGLTQIELKYDKFLKGNVIKTEIIKDLKGNIIEVTNRISDKEPVDIYLTIEEEIQSIAEEIISNFSKEFLTENIIIIVQNVKNGFITAIASHPQNYINFKAIEYTYEPGSTFKTIILSAAFEENLLNEKDLIDCENGVWKPNSKHTITDHEPLKIVTLKEAFAHSSNIGFGKIGLKIGIEKLYPYIKKFGFDSKYTDFLGESKGILKNFKDYREIDLITTSYGYGIAVTPLQLISAYTAIANNGVLIKPFLVYRIGEDRNTEAKREEIRRVISTKTAKRLTNMMVDVVENGTGINAQIPGYFIAGKTGTANKLDLKTRKYIKGENVASFCGFFPASNPEYTILVIVDNSKKYKYGGQTAAPIFAEMAKRIISIKNIKPDREIDYSKIKDEKKILITN
ncbi:MAG: penicillin-binding protein 2 [Elusimicrobiota bacterium]